MIAYLKRKLGIKDYKVCATCGLLFEPEPREEALFNLRCPEHRKPFLEQRALERWAVDWAARKPTHAKEIKTADDMETNKTFNQNLAGMQAAALQAQQKNIDYGGLSVPGHWPRYYR